MGSCASKTKVVKTSIKPLAGVPSQGNKYYGDADIFSPREGSEDSVPRAPVATRDEARPPTGTRQLVNDGQLARAPELAANDELELPPLPGRRDAAQDDEADFPDPISTSSMRSPPRSFIPKPMYPPEDSDGEVTPMPPEDADLAVLTRGAILGPSKPRGPPHHLPHYAGERRFQDDSAGYAADGEIHQVIFSAAPPLPTSGRDPAVSGSNSTSPPQKTSSPRTQRGVLGPAGEAAQAGTGSGAEVGSRDASEGEAGAEAGPGPGPGAAGGLERISTERKSGGALSGPRLSAEGSDLSDLPFHVELKAIMSKEERRARALAAKDHGNAAYKERRFDEAMAWYNEAISLDPQDIAFLTNRAAVHLHTGALEECEADCLEALRIGKRSRAGPKAMARAMARLGTACQRLDRLDEAIQWLERAQEADFSEAGAKKVQRARAVKRAAQQRAAEALVDPAKADLARQLGADLAAKGRFPEAVKHFSEAIRRDPHSPAAYEQRAGCYLKLGAMRETIADADRCLELSPTFVHAYVLKAAALSMLQEWRKAQAAAEAGLAHDAGNRALLAARGKAEREAAQGGSVLSALQRQQRALQDPEIRLLVRDPVIQQVLRDMGECKGPVGFLSDRSHEALKNPKVMAKIRKLADAGYPLNINVSALAVSL